MKVINSLSIILCTTIQGFLIVVASILFPEKLTYSERWRIETGKYEFLESNIVLIEPGASGYFQALKSRLSKIWYKTV